MIWLIAYAYVAATCGAMAWGYTDDDDDRTAREIVIASALLWPLIFPVVLIQLWRRK